MSDTNNELMRMCDRLIVELDDYNKLSRIDFLIEHDSYFEETIDKAYQDYLDHNDEEEPYDREEWQEDYEKEIENDIEESIDSFFEALEIETFKSESNEENKIHEILLACWWPGIYLKVDERYETVRWIGNWWWDHYECDLSYYYSIIVWIYNLDIY